MKSQTGGTSKQNTEKQNPHRFSAWLDEQQVKRTVRRWHRQQKHQARKGRVSALLKKVPHAGFIGDALYMVGFWTEYAGICAGRGILKVAVAVLSHVGSLLFTIFRPIGIGLVVFLEDLLQPFVRLYSGIRHIRELPELYPEESRREIRAEKMEYFKSGIRRYLPLVWNAFTYVLPVAGLVALVVVVRMQLSETYRLEVRVNGETVGYVASEQVFDSARDDVQSRISSARAVMEAAGVETEDAQWDISPTYTLAVSDQVMTESEVADAILRASSDEIGDGTAVYIDGELRYVTTEGDHLRAYLDAIKAPYEDAFDANRRVEFVHDIQLVDGVYFLSSIVPYDTVVSSLNAVTPAVHLHGAGGGPDRCRGGRVRRASALPRLQALNPDQTALEAMRTRSWTPARCWDHLQPVAELLAGQDHRAPARCPRMCPTIPSRPSRTSTTSASEVVVQEGQLGLQEVVQDVTYINGVA